MPFATTTSVLAPFSIRMGTSKYVYMLRSGSYPHRAVVMGPCVKHVIGLVVGNSYQRIILRALLG